MLAINGVWIISKISNKNMPFFCNQANCRTATKDVGKKDPFRFYILFLFYLMLLPLILVGILLVLLLIQIGIIELRSKIKVITISVNGSFFFPSMYFRASLGSKSQKLLVKQLNWFILN